MMIDTTTRTTIALPVGLLAATNRVVTVGKAKNRTELFTRANHIWQASTMMIDPTTRTTITLPAGLLAATDRVVTVGKVKNRAELTARNIKRELALIRRAEIDADLLEMAQDVEYQAEVLQLESEFCHCPMGGVAGY
jgi:metal-responsive CopG/Arc/MetJ family transcriptional regulator